jgi:uncharacterized protein (TIGR03435 family)
MKFSGILIYSYLFFAHSCLAQSSAADATPAFEVASVKPSRQAKNGDEVRAATSPDSLTIRGASLRFCIEWAYETPPFQVDAPAWLSDTGYDIFAKAAQPVTVDRLRSMLRTLLVQRLGVKVHSDHKEMHAYALTLMPGGPKFRKSTTDEPPFFGNDGRAGMLAKQVTMSEFASKISEPLGRPVIDATGLQGRYDIRIDVTSYMTAPPKDGGELDMESLLFTAFREQLGLKLVSRKSAVDILVVDHAEKAPAEN